jgi:hypothetical protein
MPIPINYRNTMEKSDKTIPEYYKGKNGYMAKDVLERLYIICTLN